MSGSKRKNTAVKFLLVLITGLFLMGIYCVNSVKGDTAASVSASLNSSETQCTVNVNGLTATSNSTVYAAVWSSDGGQDDIRWYVMSGSGSSYSYTVNISDHASSGEYNVHIYYTADGGSMVFAGSDTFEVSRVSCSGVELQNENADSGTCRVVVSGVESASGVSQVLVPIWSGDQSDIVWYTATRNSAGNYVVEFSIANHNYDLGLYYIHVYVYGNNGVSNLVGTTQFDVAAPSCESVSVENVSSSGTWEVVISGAQCPSGISSIRVPVWSQGDQSDIYWYTANRNSDGTYSVNVDVANHAYNAGRYYIHVYISGRGGSMYFVGSTEHVVESPSCDSIVVENYSQTDGTWDVVISGIESSFGINGITVPVWSKGDQSDIYWYTANRNSDGTYSVTVDAANHSYNTGNYFIHVYLRGTSGTLYYIGSANHEFELSDAAVTASVSGSEVTLTASGIKYPGTVSYIQFAVWSEVDGQDDLIWNRASYSAHRASTAITLSDYKSYGTYYVHVYLTDSAGNQTKIGETTFSVAEPSISSVNVSTTDGTGDFSVRITGAESALGINKVYVPIWSQGDQSDIVWYEAVNEGNGVYTLDSNISEHGSNFGTYIVHVYIVDSNGTYYRVGGTDFSVTYLRSDLSVERDELGLTYTISLSDVSVEGGFTGLSFAVWSIADGQDDIEWLTGTQSSGTWSADMLYVNHNSTGTYAIHVYVEKSDGTLLCIGEFYYEITSVTENTLMFSDYSDGAVTATVVPSVKSFSSLRFAVWTGDQSDIYWYYGTRQSNGSYTANINISNHQYHSGMYYVHVYYYDANGTPYKIAEGTVQLTSTLDSGDLSCVIVNGNTVRVHVQTGSSSSLTYGLFVLGAGEDSISSSSVPIATAAGTSTVTLTTPLNLDTSSSRLQSKFVIGVQSGSGYQQISDGFYITNPEAVADYTFSFPTADTKKGLQVNYSYMDDAAELGVNHTVVNVTIDMLLSGTGYQYTYNGTTYTFSASYISSLDRIAQTMSSQGVITSFIILLQYNDSALDLILPGARTSGHSFYGLNVEEEAAKKKIEAIFTFLAERYTQYNVVNWILGNEVGYSDTYYYCGNVSDSQVMEYYTDAYRTLYNAVKSVYSNARAYICLDHVWDYYRSYAITTKSALTMITEQIEDEGDITWCLAFHPYPTPLTNANFWNTTSSAVNNNQIITMKNLTYLTDYIKNNYGSEHRIILSESGFNSYVTSSGTHNETLQAAAIAYAYYLAEFNDMVDSFIVHRHVDHTAEIEQNLYLGLWYNVAGSEETRSTKKYAWTVYKYMDTSEYLNYTNGLLSTIGASSWSSIVPGFDSSRFG